MHLGKKHKNFYIFSKNKKSAPEGTEKYIIIASSQRLSMSYRKTLLAIFFIILRKSFGNDVYIPCHKIKFIKSYGNDIDTPCHKTKKHRTRNSPRTVLILLFIFYSAALNCIWV